MSSYTTTGTTTAAPAAGGRRWGRKSASGPGALAKNEAKKPQTKFVEMRANSGERWGVARAKMNEKFRKWGASMSYGAYAITHPVHPVRRRAAKDAEIQKKALATERRKQEEAAVHSNAAAKRAAAHEARIATLNQAVH